MGSCISFFTGIIKFRREEIQLPHLKLCIHQIRVKVNGLCEYLKGKPEIGDTAYAKVCHTQIIVPLCVVLVYLEYIFKFNDSLPELGRFKILLSLLHVLCKLILRTLAACSK